MKTAPGVRGLALAALLTALLTAALPLHAAGEASGPGRDPLAIGAPLPADQRDVALTGTDGETWTLAKAGGPKGTLVIFTCNHCPWAIAWEKRIAALGNELRDQGVGVIAVNSNDPAVYPADDLPGMQKRAEALGLRFPYVVDATSGVARAFGATRTPEAFLFDANGLLVYHGAVDDNAEVPKDVQAHWLRDAVTALLEGRPIAPKETKAIGCTIKFRALPPPSPPPAP